MLFIFSIIILFISTLLLISIVQFKSKVSFILAFFVLSFAQIIAIGHLGHHLSLLNSVAFYFTAQVLISIFIFIAWKIFGNKKLFSHFEQLIIPRIQWSVFFKSKWKLLILLSIFTAVIYLFSLYLGLRLPPNNNDSTAVHMSRIIYWLQNGNYLPWPTLRTTQLIYPVNSSLFLLWTILMTNGDRFVALLQWLSAVVGGISVFGIARLMGANKKSALYVFLIFLSYPIVFLQSSTTQTGNIAGALAGVSFYFLYKGIKTKLKKDILLSGVALGLVLGTKHTVFFILPGIGLSILLFWSISKSISTKNVILFSSTTILTFLFFGSQIFFLNQSIYGNLLGPSETISHQLEKVIDPNSGKQKFIVMVSRFLVQATDPSTLPSPLWQWGLKARAAIVDLLLTFLDIPLTGNPSDGKYYFDPSAPVLVHEDSAWFGFLGFLVVMPTLIYSTYIGIKEKDELKISVALITIFFLLSISLFTSGWSLNRGRYFIPAFLVATPLAFIWFENKSFRKFSSVITIIIAGCSLAYTTFYNPGKRLTTKHIPPLLMNENDPFYDDIEYSRLLLSSEQTWSEMVGHQDEVPKLQYMFLDKTLPNGIRMAFISHGEEFRDYGFFGENFHRTVIPIYPREIFYNNDWYNQNEIDYIFIIDADEFDLFKLTEFQYLESQYNYLIMERITP